MTRDGWYRTGDLATIDDDGWLTITGRLKDIIIRAGENISIREVEDTLDAHPVVTRAAVVGVAARTTRRASARDRADHR